MVREPQKLIALLLLLVITASAFPFSANAAVPVFVVGLDANTDFEKSLEQFLYNLKVAKEQFDFDLALNLAQRQEDFTAAFELQKIEKAREDVNKLVQETLQEMEDAGYYIKADDPLTDQPPLLAGFKGPRIVNDPMRYFFYEPQLAGMAVATCYYNYLIWDQRGDLLAGSNFEGDTEDKRTFGATTDESVQNIIKIRNLVWAQLGWGQYSNFNENVLAYISDEKDMNSTKPNCDKIYELYGFVPPDQVDFYLKNVHKVTPELYGDHAYTQIRRGFMGLPTLKCRVQNRNNEKQLCDKLPVWEEIASAEEDQNNISGITGIGAGLAAGAASMVKEINQANYQAGQGIRPENLYIKWAGSPDDKDYYLNTQYVISPAVVLLQKMQAATQAQFDLAQKGFLYLSPELQNDAANRDLLQKYNLAFREPKNYSVNPENKLRADNSAYKPFAALELFDNKVKNAAPASVGGPAEFSATTNPPRIGILQPWLMPNAAFRSAVKKEPSGLPIKISGSRGSGLPAPWEDENDYVKLGTPRDAGWDEGYRISRFLVSSVTPGAGETGDNIKNEETGKDFAINDWFDRVLEMYEPSKGQSFWDGTGGLKDWKCYVVTWFKGRVMKGHPFPGTNDPLDFNTECGHRLSDKSY